MKRIQLEDPCLYCKKYQPCGCAIDAQKRRDNKELEETMEEDRTGQYFMSVKGKKLFVQDPRPEDIDVEEIAHALSCVNRFGGHVPHGPYSVAQHSIYVAQYVIGRGHPELGMLALMHDAPEAFLGDVIRPIKRSPLVTQAYFDAEVAWGRAIGAALGFEWIDPLPAIVKEADNAVLFAEERDLFPASHRLNEPGRIAPWIGTIEKGVTQAQAKEAFLLKYEQIRRARP